MSIGRRKVKLEDQSAWIFNRMVQAYEARPPYPCALIESIAQLTDAKTRRALDIGAGLGHVTLPLAQRGFDVTAVEPALAMLTRLGELAAARGLSVKTVHAMAEALPLENAAFDLVVVSDAVHFLDTERAAYELARVLAPRGALALVTCEFSPTPFMQAVEAVMESAAPRRPRDVSSSLTQMLAVSEVRRLPDKCFTDTTPVDPTTLEGILKSISFIGPAMNRERHAAFRRRILAIEHERCWARRFTLSAGRRTG